MTTQERIEKKGYKVSYCISGRYVMAKKGNTTITAENITQLLKKIY